MRLPASRVAGRAPSWLRRPHARHAGAGAFVARVRLQHFVVGVDRAIQQRLTRRRVGGLRRLAAVHVGRPPGSPTSASGSSRRCPDRRPAPDRAGRHHAATPPPGAAAARCARARWGPGRDRSRGRTASAPCCETRTGADTSRRRKPGASTTNRHVPVRSPIMREAALVVGGGRQIAGIRVGVQRADDRALDRLAGQVSHRADGARRLRQRRDGQRPGWREGCGSGSKNWHWGILQHGARASVSSLQSPVSSELQ